MNATMDTAEGRPKDRATSTGDEAILEEAKERFRHVQTAERENREAFEDDVKFAIGEQWDAAAQREREQYGRPCLTINRMPQFIRQVVNDARQNRPGVKVHPQGNGADTDTAEVLQGMIRHIETRSNADQAYDTALYNAVAGGFGYWRVVTDYVHDRTFEQEVKIERVRNPLAIYMDPAAQEPDGSDARYCFITERIPKDQFEDMFPDAEQTDVELQGQGDEDRADWYDEDTVRIAEYWCVKEKPVTLVLMVDDRVMDDAERQPQNDDDPLDPDSRVNIVSKRTITRREVKWYLLSGSQVLDKRDWPGKYIPVVRLIGDEVDVNGRLHTRSLIRDAKDPQRMYNFWSSAETEHVQQIPLAPYIGTAEQFEGYEEYWEDAHRRPRAYLPYNPDPQTGQAPQRQPAAQQQTGIMQAKMAVSDDMKAVTGIYDAALGQRSNETSGIAIRQRQQEGDTSTFHFIDNLARSIRQTGRILVDLIPHIYDTDRYVRLLWEDESTEEARLVPGMQQREDEELQQIRQSARRIADPTTGRYDITVSTGPSYQTKRQEAAESMMQFMQAMPETSQVVADLIAKAMDWPGSDEIAKRLKKTLPPGIAEDEDGEQQPQQAPNPELIKAQQDMQIKQAELQQKEAEAQREHQRKIAEMEMDAHIRLLELNAKHDTDYQKSQLDALTKLQQADIQARQRDNAQSMQEQTRERTEAMRARQQAQQNTGQSGGGSQRNQ